MSLELYPNRAAWLEARRLSIGASDSWKLLGCAPSWFRERNWRDECLRSKLGAEVQDNAAMRAGRIFEPAILEYWADGIGATLHRPSSGGFALYRHPRLAFVTATPDRFARIGDECVVAEAKRCAPKHAEHWEEVPLAYSVQVQQQLWVLSEDGDTPEPVRRGFLTVDLGGADIRSFEILPDPELWALMESVYRHFWEQVEQARRSAVAATGAN